MNEHGVPDWSGFVIAAPGGGQDARLSGRDILSGSGKSLGRVDEGILRFGVKANDPSIEFYKTAGGADFHARSKVGYAMTSLDTPVYHAYLDRIAPDTSDGIIVDIGGGDGRNAMPWLHKGYRVILVDPIFDALLRFRRRLEADQAELLHRILLIEGDARQLPLLAGACRVAQSIEALAYLNEEYEFGIKECLRVMADDARLLIADRDYEGGLLMRLFYFGGIAGMLKYAGTRDIWDGSPDNLVRSRCFTVEEYRAMAESSGLEIVEESGISSMSLVLAHLRSLGKIGPEEDAHLPQVHALLKELAGSGRMRRSHVLICRKNAHRTAKP
jgi:ubiquinone/menaquinone biosynthesis C-methylase UbiE